MTGSRFHILSVTAIFLAVVVGLVLGTTAFGGGSAGGPYDEAGSLRRSNAELRDEVAGLEKDLAGREAYLAEAVPLLLDGKLTDRTVLLVALPGVPISLVRAVAGDLRVADATVTGTLRITDELVAPGNREDARDLATRLLPAGVKDVSPDGDGVAASAALLAAVLLEHDPVVAATDRTAALAGYRAQEFIGYDEPIAEAAEAAIVLTGRPRTRPASTAAERNAGLLRAVREFGAAGPVVVAAPVRAGGRDVVTAVRDDSALAEDVSTVDNVNTLAGRVAAALALVQRLADDATGHYGVDRSADRRLPKPES